MVRARREARRVWRTLPQRAIGSVPARLTDASIRETETVAGAVAEGGTVLIETEAISAAEAVETEALIVDAKSVAVTSTRAAAAITGKSAGTLAHAFGAATATVTVVETGDVTAVIREGSIDTPEVGVSGVASVTFAVGAVDTRAVGRAVGGAWSDSRTIRAAEVSEAGTRSIGLAETVSRTISRTHFRTAFSKEGHITSALSELVAMTVSRTIGGARQVARETTEGSRTCAGTVITNAVTVAVVGASSMITSGSSPFLVAFAEVSGHAAAVVGAVLITDGLITACTAPVRLAGTLPDLMVTVSVATARDFGLTVLSAVGAGAPEQLTACSRV